MVSSNALVKKSLALKYVNYLCTILEGLEKDIMMAMATWLMVNFSFKT